MNVWDDLGESRIYIVYVTIIMRQFSEEHRRKLREAKLGKKLPESTKAKMSAVRSGENNPFYGKTHSETTKKLLREKKNHISKETREKLRLAKLGRPSNHKGISHLEESIEKMRVAKQGYVPWNTGRPATKEEKQHLQEIGFQKGHDTWNKGVPTSEETIRKMQEARRLRSEKDRSSKE
jgi:hypothetical protein